MKEDGGNVTNLGTDAIETDRVAAREIVIEIGTRRTAIEARTRAMGSATSANAKRLTRHRTDPKANAARKLSSVHSKLRPLLLLRLPRAQKRALAKVAIANVAAAVVAVDAAVVAGAEAMRAQATRTDPRMRAQRAKLRRPRRRAATRPLQSPPVSRVRGASGITGMLARTTPSSG